MPTTILDRLLAGRSERSGLEFDRANNVETAKIVQRPDLVGMPSELRQHAGDYVPSNPGLVRRIIRTSRIDPSQFTFVDLGCGKGRALIAASAFPFKALVGIEADAHLLAAAERNLESWDSDQSNRRIQLIHSDARNAEFPEGNLFIFMFSPFRGPVFEAVATRLAAFAGESGRAVVIGYSADFEGDILQQSGTFVRRRLWRRQFWAPASVSLFYNEAAERMRK